MNTINRSSNYGQKLFLITIFILICFSITFSYNFNISSKLRLININDYFRWEYHRLDTIMGFGTDYYLEEDSAIDYSKNIEIVFGISNNLIENRLSAGLNVGLSIPLTGVLEYEQDIKSEDEMQPNEVVKTRSYVDLNQHQNMKFQGKLYTFPIFFNINFNATKHLSLNLLSGVELINLTTIWETSYRYTDSTSSGISIGDKEERNSKGNLYSTALPFIGIESGFFIIQGKVSFGIVADLKFIGRYLSLTEGKEYWPIDFNSNYEKVEYKYGVSTGNLNIGFGVKLLF